MSQSFVMDLILMYSRATQPMMVFRVYGVFRSKQSRVTSDLLGPLDELDLERRI
jgi:hypothetical protein